MRAVIDFARFRALSQGMERIMTRKYIDCREFPSDINCSVAIAADSEKELLEIAVQHAVTAHKHTDTPDLRLQLRKLFKDGTPPEHLAMPGMTKTSSDKAETGRHH
jgi:predicted small metal-binding protein